MNRYDTPKPQRCPSSTWYPCVMPMCLLLQYHFVMVDRFISTAAAENPSYWRPISCGAVGFLILSRKNSCSFQRMNTRFPQPQCLFCIMHQNIKSYIFFCHPVQVFFLPGLNSIIHDNANQAIVLLLDLVFNVEKWVYPSIISIWMEDLMN